jgi:hypothetical protein
MLIPPHIQQFNQKVKQMNQQGSSNLALSQSDARNLHSDIFALITKIANLQEQLLKQNNNSPDGGGW